MANSNRSLEKEQFWRLVLDEQAASGLSVRAFCRQEGISEPSYYAWRKELAVRDAKPVSRPDKPHVVPVQVIDSKAADPKAAGPQAANLIADQGNRAELSSVREDTIIEIGTPDGFILRADVATDAEVITTWLGAIAKATRS
ncbi:transposase [Pirellulaceae bacterium]|nr:transposase [Pirellulaceae bacterium]